MEEWMKEPTRQEWQELGFFYDRDDSAKEWLIVGSRAGLLRFADLLRRYAANPRNEMKSEHEHYGPYMDLEIMTWTEAGMDDHAIHGSVRDLIRLASLIEGKVATLQSGERARIREEFSPRALYSLVLDLRGDSFDPASADGNLVEPAG